MWISFRTEPKAYIQTAAGYLIAMWAAKSILGGMAPKTPSILDYVIVFLFVIQTIVIALRAYAENFAKRRPSRAGFGSAIKD